MAKAFPVGWWTSIIGLHCIIANANVQGKQQNSSNIVWPEKNLTLSIIEKLPDLLPVYSAYKTLAEVLAKFAYLSIIAILELQDSSKMDNMLK